MTVNRSTRALLALALLVGLLAPLAGPADAQGDPEPEIIGGGLADPGEYPFMVALLQRRVDDRYQGQFCGGSLINETAVLTAAHCVVNDVIQRRANRVDVLIGSNRLAPGPGRRLHVTAVHVHPGYNPRTSGNDLAVLELAEAATEDPIPVIGPGHFDLWDPGTVATVIGWGDRDRRDNVNAYPVRLYEVTVPIVSNAQCTNAYRGAYLKAKMVCAGDLANGGRDSCQGDSGGPLFVPDGGSGVVQVGIVSFGAGCGIARFPGVYTRVARYASFLAPYLPT
jgi:secreted trypsin-like serine protease